MSVGEVPNRQKASVPNALHWAKARRLKENRHLAILLENISLSVLSVSNEFSLSDISLCAMLHALCDYSWGRMGGENRIECELFLVLGNRSEAILSSCRFITSAAFSF